MPSTCQLGVFMINYFLSLVDTMEKNADLLASHGFRIGFIVDDFVSRSVDVNSRVEQIRYLKEVNKIKIAQGYFSSDWLDLLSKRYKGVLNVGETFYQEKVFDALNGNDNDFLNSINSTKLEIKNLKKIEADRSFLQFPIVASVDDPLEAFYRLSFDLLEDFNPVIDEDYNLRFSFVLFDSGFEICIQVWIDRDRLNNSSYSGLKHFDVFMRILNPSFSAVMPTANFYSFSHSPFLNPYQGFSNESERTLCIAANIAMLNVIFSRLKNGVRSEG